MIADSFYFVVVVVCSGGGVRNGDVVVISGSGDGVCLCTCVPSFDFACLGLFIPYVFLNVANLFWLKFFFLSPSVELDL